MVERFNIAFNYLKGKGIIKTQKDAAIKIGMTQGNLSKALKGDDRYLTESFIKRFNESFNGMFNANWIISGEGSMLKDNKEFRHEITPVPEDSYMMVEYVDLRASAGRLGGADIEQLPETHKRLIPKEYKNGGFLVVRVDGDSMDDGTKRSLSDGDEVLIAEKTLCKIDELPIKKTLFVITSREGNVLKQITEVNMEEKYIVCHSFNPQYQDFKMYFDDIYQIFIVCKITQKQISLV